MFHLPETVDVPVPRRMHWLTERGFLSPWIALSLLFGLLLGSVVGLFLSLPVELSRFLSVEVAGRGFLHELLRGSCFAAAALLLATSFLGFAFLPALSALRGWLLGCGVAAVLRTDGFAVLPAAFFSIAIPALLGLPAFLLAASDGARCSLQLLRFFGRGERRPPDGMGEFPRHFALIVLLCTVEALYSAFLLPMLLIAVS